MSSSKQDPTCRVRREKKQTLADRSLLTQVKSTPRRQMMKSFFRRLVLGCYLGMACSGCGLIASMQAKPVPEIYQSYVGTWKAEGVEFNIHRNGSLIYKAKDERSSIRLEAPIHNWSANGFSAGALFFQREFKVTKAPHKVNGQWQMVVNGNRLTRIKLQAASEGQP